MSAAPARAAPSRRLIFGLFSRRALTVRAERTFIGIAAAAAITFSAHSTEELGPLHLAARPPDLKVVTSYDGERFVDISVLTYNVKGLPWPLRLDLEEGDAGKAMEAIGRHLGSLRAKGRAPHIVLIQEGFPDETALIGAFGGYRHAVEGPRREDADRPLTVADTALAAGADWRSAETQGPLLNSGLHAFSDFPLTIAASEAFGRHACAGYDCLAAKGVLAVVARIPGIPDPVNLLTMHMNASAGTAGVPAPRAEAAHHLQLDRLAEVLDRFDTSSPLIFAGDFNVKQNVSRQRYADERLGPAGLTAVHVRCRQLGATCEAGYPTRWGAHWLEPRDIQGFRGGATVSVRPLASEPMFVGPYTGGKMSDHVGYLVRYRLSWRPALVQVARAD